MNFPDKHKPKPQETTRSAYTFTLPLLLLLSFTVVFQLAAVAYTSEQRFSDVLLPSVIGLLIITAPLAALGLWPDTKIGLGAPLLTALLSRSPGAGHRQCRMK